MSRLPRPLRILALMPRVEPGLRVTPAPLFSALGAGFDVRFAVPTRAESIESLLQNSFGTDRADWIALPDHDQSILPRGLGDSPVPRVVWIDDAYVAPVERLRWLQAVRPRLALFTQGRWARFYRDASGAAAVAPTWRRSAHFSSAVEPGGRNIDVLLYGRLDPRVYPFRARLARLLPRLRPLRVCLLEHPGYGGGDGWSSLAEHLPRQGRAGRRDAPSPAPSPLLRGSGSAARSRPGAAPRLPRSRRAAGRAHLAARGDQEIIDRIRAAVVWAERSRAEIHAGAVALLANESVDARARVLGRELVRRASPKEANEELD
ncbi:MAG: hypothetical protein U0527_02620 [Candidatus Eisenbacteria bacterium]